MSDIVKRLREPPFGTETSERNLMASAADEIERLREALAKIAQHDMQAIALDALQPNARARSPLSVEYKP